MREQVTSIDQLVDLSISDFVKFCSEHNKGELIGYIAVIQTELDKVEGLKNQLKARLDELVLSDKEPEYREGTDSGEPIESIRANQLQVQVNYPVFLQNLNTVYVVMSRLLDKLDYLKDITGTSDK